MVKGPSQEIKKNVTTHTSLIYMYILFYRVKKILLDALVKDVLADQGRYGVEDDKENTYTQMHQKEEGIFSNWSLLLERIPSNWK